MYQVIDGVKVYGEHEDKTVQQLVNCTRVGKVLVAELMPDGHYGYSMPVGGTIAYDNQVSPSGVGYDIACIATDTPVMTDAGYHIPVQSVKKEHHIVKSDSGRLCRVENNGGAIYKGNKPVYEVQVVGGRLIKATSDHLFFSESGWKSLDQLGVADHILVSPFLGLPYRGLDPEYDKLSKLSIVLRLFGYVSGDGNISPQKNRVSIWTSVKEDVPKIVSDVEMFGKVGVLERKGVYHIYTNSEFLHNTLADFGSPIGKKVWDNKKLEWLLELPDWAKAQFLSGFCSAEMSTPHLTSTYLANLALKQAYDTDKDNPVYIIKELLKTLGFESNVTKNGKARNGIRQDLVLQVLGGEKEQVRFFEQIGFCYTSKKREAAARMTAYSWSNTETREFLKDAKRYIQTCRSKGIPLNQTLKDAYERYGVERSFVYHTYYGRLGSPRIQYSHTIAEHPETVNEMVWSRIKSIEKVGQESVYDIVTGDPKHSFLANGFVVHNCGNRAVLTDIPRDRVLEHRDEIADLIFKNISFGMGRNNEEKVDHPLFEDPLWRENVYLYNLKDRAANQLGTVGSGNHFVDVMEDDMGRIWVACHFGSRGFGHGVASGYLNLAKGRKFGDRVKGESMEALPTVFDILSDLGAQYWMAMLLAGQYAYAGREWVTDKVVSLLGGNVLKDVHNHHNFAWMQKIDFEGQDKTAIVVRKGSTPNRPGQESFIGGSMGHLSVIARGKHTPENQDSMYTTVHGAGRLMGRRAAKKTIDPHQVAEMLKSFDVTVRGGDLDESPLAYRNLADVLPYLLDTTEVLHYLKPIVVCMAGKDTRDEYKD